MADMVRALETRGLVRRERNPANRRELLILLTDAGRALLDDLAGPVGELEERMIRDLTSRQVGQFRDTLTDTWRALS
jgi:DNA-binding MarR family transcriptional regulator